MELAHTSTATPLKIVATWLQRKNSREKLKSLSDRALKDIGLTRQEIESEIRKPFWKA